jgi:Zn-dependent protease with chaperone function
MLTVLRPIQILRTIIRMRCIDRILVFQSFIMRKSTIIFPVIILLALSCQRVAVTGRKQLNLVPNALIQSMAFTEYDSFLTATHILPASNADTRMVQQVGTRIQKAVTAYMDQNNLGKQIKSFRWEYNLVDENVVNAWCMPGGKVVVYTGLLPVTQNETALAVVMGHEIAHAVARHGNERMSEGLLIQMGGIVLEEALKEKKQETQLLFLSLYIVGSHLALALPNSRMQESEADKLGLIFMSMAGYDPNEAIPFWQRMAAVNPGGQLPEFLSTHPSDETRIKQLSAIIPGIRTQYYKQQ